MNKVAWRLFIFGFWKVIFKKLFLKYFYVYLLLEKLVNKKYFLVNEKYFLVKNKFILVFRKVFFFILSGKHFLENVKNLEISYYFLIISNLILKLLIDICIYILFWIFVFQFHPLKFNFYINFGPHFYFAFFLLFFNWNFLSIKFDPHSFDYYLFYLK